MLSCREVTEYGSAWLDGELSRRERLAVRMHLLMCVRCRRFNRQLGNLVAALRRRRPADPVDREFIDRVMNRVNNALTEQTGPNPQTE